MRLIDADELKKDLKENAVVLTKPQFYSMDDVDYIIDNIPAVDAVPVVRCKNCIGKASWYKNDYGNTICGLSGLFVVKDSDFCSYSVRREDNDG